MNEVRIAFNLNLARIYQPAAQQKGFQECHNLIKEHADDEQMVRVVIGALTDKSFVGVKEKGNDQAKGFHASMFGTLASIFKIRMIDHLH